MDRTIARRELLTGLAAGGVTVSTAGCLDSLTGGGSGGEYPSRTIEFETPNPPGGGSDAYLRALAPALSEVFGVDVTPLNRTPAEQRIPTLFNGGENGYNVITFNPTIHAWRIVNEGRETPYNGAQWGSLGAPNTSSLILVASTQTDVETWDDVISGSESGTTYRAAEIGAGHGMYYTVMDNNSAASFENISGFEGTGEIVGELERGNVDFYIAPAASLLSYVDDGIARPILTGNPGTISDFMHERYAEIGHEGIAPDTYEDVGLGMVGTLVQSIRMCLAPPAVPDDRLSTLQDGFWEAFNSDTFASNANEQNLPRNLLNAEDLKQTLEEKADLLVDLDVDV